MLTLAGCVATHLPAVRGDEPPPTELSVSAVRLGSRVCGPQVTPQAFAHRVVVLEFWGVACPPCLKSMPALEALHRELGPAGLLVVGAHAQEATPAEIEEVVDDLGVTFPIVERAHVEGGMDFTGIPHCLVFDHTGICVYRGHPNRAHDVIVAAVRSSPAMVLEGRALVKLAALGRQLRDEAAFGAVLTRAEGLVDARDADTAAEAAYVVERLRAYGTRLLDAARSARDDDPLRALHDARRCAAAFRGTPAGADAESLLGEWRKDAAFQDGLVAARTGRQLEMTRERLVRALGDPETITPEIAGKVPERVRRQLADAVETIQRLRPGTPLAERADAIASEFGLTVVR